MNGQPFDTSRINGKEIEDWVYPFMMRKIKWDGIFDELKAVLGTDEFDIQFSGTRAAMKVLMEDCPETVAISYQKTNQPTATYAVSRSEQEKTAPEPTSVDAETLYKKGKKCYDNGELERAVGYYKQAAEMDYADAQLALGVCYFNGNGITENEKKAEKLFRKAVENGNINALVRLGKIYEVHFYRDDDGSALKQSANFYRRAAELGDAEGQFALGECYFGGCGVQKSPEQGSKWLRKAAEQGYAMAQWRLGLCYKNEIGVSHNDSEMLKWFRAAAEQGNEDAQYELGMLYYHGKGGLREDDTEAVRWFEKAATKDCIDAQFMLGVCYRDGNGVEQNSVQAVIWFKRVLETAIPDLDDEIIQETEEEIRKIQEEDVLIRGFDHYDDGKYAEAVECFLDAADNGNSDAMFMLGLCYELGNGVRQDYHRAVDWYERAAALDDATAQERLGDLYAEGIGVALDKVESAKWYRKAAENGNMDAKARLGVCYIVGEGVTENNEYGMQLLKEAAEQGSEIAKEIISEFNKAYEEAYDEAYENAYNGAYHDVERGTNFDKFINTAGAFIRSDKGKKFLKIVGKGAAGGAATGLSGGSILSVLGGAATGAAGAALTAFADDEDDEEE